MLATLPLLLNEKWWLRLALIRNFGRQEWAVGGRGSLQPSRWWRGIGGRRGLLSALDAVVSGRCLANCAPKCPFTAMALFWSWLFHGLCSALKALRCGGTYVRWDSFFVQKRSLWSGSFVCAPFGVVAHGFGRPATTPWFRCLRENLKEVTFSREGWVGEVGSGVWRLGRDDWVTVETAQQHARHLEWTAARDGRGAEKNKAGQVPAASSSLPALPDTEKTNARLINIFPLGFQKKRKEEKKAWANR